MYIDKYEPKKLDDLLINDNVKSLIASYLEKKTIPHLLFAGKQGIGKTTLANIIVSELDSTFLYISCSLDNSVSTIRTKVKDFCDSVPINSDVPKIVILDEADALSSTGEGEGGKSSAQGALRNLIDESSDDTRFILTCNYITRIIKPLKSRCTPIQLSSNINDITKRVINIIKTEGITFTKPVLKEFVQEVIRLKYPDIRAILTILEHWTISGELKNTGVNIGDENIDDVVYKIFEIILSNGLKNTREWYLNNENLFGNDYQKLSTAIFNNLMDYSDRQEIVADSLRQQPFVLDNEVEFYNMLIKLKRLL
jgi:replication factor C small subunit